MQVSLAIRRGYIPYKSQTANTKTSVLGLNWTENTCISSLFAVFSDFLSRQIIETANGEGRLQCCREMFAEEYKLYCNALNRSCQMQKNCQNLFF